MAESRTTGGGFPPDLERAAGFIRRRLGEVPPRAVILGSGLGLLAESLERRLELPYAEIPGFPEATVEGHTGRMAAGRLQDAHLLVLRGRVHAYEGYSQEQVVFPIRLLAALGVGRVLLTNAVGSIDRDLHPGDLVLLEDQINQTFRNPLRGPNAHRLGPRFPDMSTPTSDLMNNLARETADRLGVPLRGTVMGGVLGPSYETPAEIRMLQRLGAGVVGMSTIPELIAAAHLGLEACAISCVTNYAAGIGKDRLDHAEVTTAAESARVDFIRLVAALMAEL